MPVPAAVTVTVGAGEAAHPPATGPVFMFNLKVLVLQLLAVMPVAPAASGTGRRVQQCASGP